MKVKIAEVPSWINQLLQTLERAMVEDIALMEVGSKTPAAGSSYPVRRGRICLKGPQEAEFLDFFSKTRQGVIIPLTDAKGGKVGLHWSFRPRQESASGGEAVYLIELKEAPLK